GAGFDDEEPRHDPAQGNADGGGEIGGGIPAPTSAPWGGRQTLSRLINIRPAAKSDEAALGPLGAALMRQHHASNPHRFILTDRPEAGYGRFLVSQLANPDCLVLVAELSKEIVG